MKKIGGGFLAVIFVSGLFSAVLPAAPALSPAALRDAQSRAYNADKATLFGAVLSTLQDEGFTISTADMNSGFVSAESVSSDKTNFWDALEGNIGSGSTRATIVIQGPSAGPVRIRITLVSNKNISSGGGQAAREDRPINVSAPYDRLYAKIDAAAGPGAVAQIAPASAYIDRSAVVPVAPSGKPVVADLAKDAAATLTAIKAWLEGQGFKTISFSVNDGYIATAPKPYPMTSDTADCGKVFGISYLKDKRTATDVQIFAEISGGKISITTSINGVYRPGYGNPDKPLTCTSKGMFEAKLIADINK